MGYKHIIFDFNGTLVDTDVMLEEILEHLIHAHRLRIDPGDFKKNKNLSMARKLRLLLVMLRLKGEFEQLYGEKLDRCAPQEGVLSLMASLRSLGYSLSILSSNSAANVAKFLRLHDGLADCAILTTKGISGKRRALRDFIRRHRCSPADILYIGDELRDVRACNKAGVDIAFARWGVDGGEDTSALRIRLAVSTPEDLLGFLACES